MDTLLLSLPIINGHGTASLRIFLNKVDAIKNKSNEIIITTGISDYDRLHFSTNVLEVSNMDDLDSLLKEFISNCSNYEKVDDLIFEINEFFKITLSLRYYQRDSGSDDTIISQEDYLNLKLNTPIFTFNYSKVIHLEISNITNLESEKCKYTLIEDLTDLSIFKSIKLINYLNNSFSQNVIFPNKEKLNVPTE
ncbi:MAG: hypothetical protein [Bacteriophage sp.]|nr:MAG: hypothetical protein [Bacteriophage sp.]